ncbi:MAG: bifunctional folylpolyglutamate synthase/ dihydrofolate synthase [Desulfovibrio sp.]|nr:bifunctional folylpolyglutamate synthase/ dihydrofolate synthase [Desulfovibrio sp.]
MKKASAEKFATFRELLDWLDRKGMFSMELGLGRMRRALTDLNLSQPAGIGVQVLGTNGKGSTCAFLTSLARASGLKTGTYLSPHFVSPRERILIDDKPAGEELWRLGANEIFEACPGAENLTYFEFLTLLALVIFRSADVGAYILEAGLGGKNDATSAIPVAARCFAPVSMDHAAIIGPTLADIARDKAAVIDTGSLNFSASQYPAVKEILEDKARGANLRFVEPLPPHDLPLAGDHQFVNAALALECWRAFYPGAMVADLNGAFIPGRAQNISLGKAKIILDGAHNPGAAQSLARYLKRARIAPSSLIFSCLADKDWKTTLAILLKNSGEATVFFTELANSRATPLDDMIDFFRSTYPARPCQWGRFDEYFNRAILSGGTILLAGSLYLLGEFYALYPEYLIKTDKEE